MGHARSIGRIGALAVALGVGYGATPAVALADTEGSAGSDNSSASSAASPEPARQARPARGGGRAATARPPADSAPAAAQDTAAPSAGDVEPAPEAEAAPADRRGSESASTAQAPASPAGDSAPPAAKAPREPSAAAAAEPPSAAAAEPPSAAAAAPEPTAAADPPAPARGSRAPAAAVVAPAAAVSAPPAATPAPAGPLAATGAGRLLSAALAPLLAGGPGGAPTQAPGLWALMAWARRELEKLLPAGQPAAVITTSQAQSPNLLANPGAEVGDPSLSGMSAVSIPGWTLSGTPTVIEYGTPRTIWATGLSFAMPDLPSIWSFPSAKNGATNGGAQFFGGGNVADATISQTVDLSTAGSAIDGGNVSYNLGAWLGGYSFDPSAASVKVTFLDESKNALGAGKIGPVTAWDRLFAINLLERSTTGTLPVGTRYAQVDLFFDEKNPIKYGFNADYNDAFADNISFTIGAPLPAPPPPAPIASSPPALDHVFMVYGENKGYTNIVDSPNAPYLNGLIRTYGLADNYYALTHPSLPNYYPIIGGTDYGFTYNCGEPCIDAPKEQTMPGRLELAGKTWKSYALGLTADGSPLVSTDEYTTDQTGFPAFEWIAADPAYAKERIVPFDRMAVDLQSAETTPNYVWFAADEQFNGEGPVSGISGALRFVLNQFDPDHQYNVRAFDEFLSTSVPTILDSPVWNDPSQKSVVVVTFDEDNMNTSLGFGNEGNRVVTVVIPSPGAVAAGMRGGSFTATNHYNHYSLLRFIEDSLGVAPITNNDRHAAPMNEFWGAPANTGGGSAVL